MSREQHVNFFGRRELSEKERKRRARKRDGRRCRGCGSDENLTVHHILPRSKSGRTGSRNLITLCLHCHQYWHRTERQHYAISFEEWLKGGEARRLAFERSKLLRIIAEGRWTGQSYDLIAVRLNEAGRLTPRGREWSSSNLALWVRRNAPELSAKHSKELVKWPFFAKPLEPGIWRWYFFDNPLGVSHFRGERRVLDKYNFSRYHKTTGKFLATIVPVSGMHVYRGDVDLKLPSVRPPANHDGPLKQIVGFLNGGRLRRARRVRGGAYLFSGPEFGVPEDFVDSDGWGWVAWENVEAVILRRVRKWMRKRGRSVSECDPGS